MVCVSGNSNKYVHKDLRNGSDVPFIVGRSASKSFNMNANVQQLVGAVRTRKVVTPHAFVKGFIIGLLNPQSSIFAQI